MNNYMFAGYYLSKYELKEMRKDYKYWLNNGYKRVPGCNERALYIVNSDNTVELLSYYTTVLLIDINDHKYYKLWSGYSVTTLKHVNALLNMYGFNTVSKKEWENLRIDKSCFI